MNVAALAFALLCVPPDVHLPPLSDLARFPDAQTTADNVAWQRAHVAWIQTQIPLDLVNVDFWRGWYDDADTRRVAWSNLKEVQDDAERWPNTAREALAKLRGRLPPEDYATGQMPCPTPALWRFRRGS